MDAYETRKGEQHVNAKLTIEAVREIRAVRAKFRKCRKSPDLASAQRTLAEKFGVTPTAISHVVRGKTWRGVS